MINWYSRLHIESDIKKTKVQLYGDGVGKHTYVIAPPMWAEIETLRNYDNIVLKVIAEIL